MKEKEEEKMKFLKTALFAFICAIMFAIVQVITNVAPIAILTVLSALICIAALVAWLCSKIFNRFKHSLNIVLIIIFFVLSVVCYLFQPDAVQVESFGDFAGISIISLAWIASTLACSISILTLIGRVILEKKETVQEQAEAAQPAAIDPTQDTES